MPTKERFTVATEMTESVRPIAPYLLPTWSKGDISATVVTTSWQAVPSKGKITSRPKRGLPSETWPLFRFGRVLAPASLSVLGY